MAYCLPTAINILLLLLVICHLHKSWSVLRKRNTKEDIKPIVIRYFLAQYVIRWKHERATNTESYTKIYRFKCKGCRSNWSRTLGLSSTTWTLEKSVLTPPEGWMYRRVSIYLYRAAFLKLFFKWGPLSLVRMFYGSPYSWDYQTH